jgi:hypothetical protein
VGIENRVLKKEFRKKKEAGYNRITPVLVNSIKILGEGPAAGCFEHGDELSGFMNCCEFFN